MGLKEDQRFHLTDEDSLSLSVVPEDMLSDTHNDMNDKSVNAIPSLYGDIPPVRRKQDQLTNDSQITLSSLSVLLKDFRKEIIEMVKQELNKHYDVRIHRLSQSSVNVISIDSSCNSIEGQERTLGDSITSVVHIAPQANHNLIKSFGKGKENPRHPLMEKIVQITPNPIQSTFANQAESVHSFIEEGAEKARSPTPDSVVKKELMKWHFRLGHANPKTIISTLRQQGIKIGEMSKQVKSLINDCPTCIKSKSKRKSVKKITANPSMVALEPMDVWSVDLIGPFSKVINGEHLNLSTIGGHSYCMVILDNASRYCMVELLHRKSDASAALMKIICRKQKLFGRKLKRLHCDGGGEFNNNRLEDFLSQEGIEITNTCADSSEHNGLVERMNQKLETDSRTLIHQAKGPVELWGNAIFHSAVLHNNSASQALNGKTPFNVFHQSSIHQQYSVPVDELKVFGCDVSINHSDNENLREKAIYLGYSRIHKSHHLLMCDSLTERYEYDENVIIDETSFSNLSSVKDNIFRLAERRHGENSPEDTQWEVIRLINSRIFRGKQQYLVQWKRYQYPTWESAQYLLEDCPQSVEEYHNERKTFK